MEGIPGRKKEEVKTDEKESKDIKIYYFSLVLLALFGVYMFFPGTTIPETATETPTVSPSSPQNTHAPETTPSPTVDKVKIVLLHGNHRCTSCINMEKWTNETIEMYFLEEQKNGKIEFLVLNYQDPQNKEIVSRYNEHPYTSIYAETIIKEESHITEIEDAWYYQTDREKFIAFMREYIKEAMER